MTTVLFAIFRSCAVLLESKLPQVIASTIDHMRASDGIAIAGNFVADGRTTLIIDSILRLILGWSRMVPARTPLAIASCAASFTAYIEPLDIRVVAVSRKGGQYHTKLKCVGRVRRTPIRLPATCSIVWQLDENESLVQRAIVQFRTGRPSFLWDEESYGAASSTTRQGVEWLN